MLREMPKQINKQTPETITNTDNKDHNNVSRGPAGGKLVLEERLTQIDFGALNRKKREMKGGKGPKN